MSHLYPFFCVHCLRNNSEIIRLINDLAANHGKHGFDLSNLSFRHGEVVAIQYQEIGIFAALQGA